MSLQSDYYKTAILQLKRGNYNGHVSNAKTYYLLSILERIDKGLLVDNKIKFDDESKKFYEIQCLAYKDVVTPFVKPYFHLSSSLFYHIKWTKGTKVESYAKTPSGKFLKEKSEYAYLDDSFWELLKGAEYRKEIKQLIVKTFLKLQ
ncbi:hypothetical protein [Segatella copri]|uniref:hypothetical protein n=1 Tax=Segatella copri TaxID=165179 RepID=UPI003F8CA49E